MFCCNSNKMNGAHYAPNVHGKISRDKILADAGVQNSKKKKKLL